LKMASDMEGLRQSKGGFAWLLDVLKMASDMEGLRHRVVVMS
jgi:hypothetical protein